ncbi:MAG: trypsin-like peptidase domain-containing protein [Gammaproteobacteria bacterium]|nr:trypsin-like peptidase domain-containing protein [Gammaproteobacteria bacterium]
MKKHNERGLHPEELKDIVSTGARPISFAEKEEDYLWGFGSSFLVAHNEYIYALTAKHVVEKNGVDYHHARILIPNAKIALPFTNVFLPSFPDYENREELEDFVIYKTNSELFSEESDVDLFAWRFDTFTWPASKLEIGAQILIAGFPANDDRYDWKNNKILERLVISIGVLNESELGKGIYVLELDPSESTFGGLSGAPLFCRREGHVYFIGLAIRGSAGSGKIHFIGSEFIRSAFGFIDEGKVTY